MEILDPFLSPVVAEALGLLISKGIDKSFQWALILERTRKSGVLASSMCGSSSTQIRLVLKTSKMRFCFQLIAALQVDWSKTSISSIGIRTDEGVSYAIS